MNSDRTDQIRKHIQKDPFACWLGAEVEILEPGSARATMKLTEDMVNFHGKTHGGVIFSLCDMAFAAASNSHGQTSMGVNVGIHYLKATGPGDVLVAEATEQSNSGPMGLYDILVKDGHTGELVAKSQGLVYRKKEWFVARESE